MPKTIFLSSTYNDLKSHRKQIWQLFEDYDVNIRGMEEFGARPESPLETCLAEVEQSDMYFGVIAYKLGSVHEPTGKSFTQLEYEKALDLEKDIYIYLIDEDASIKITDIDEHENLVKLNSFKKTLKERHTVDFFKDEEDLCEKIKNRIDEILEKKEQEENEEEVDEYNKSEIMINKFLLQPKTYSGREIKLDFTLAGKLFPVAEKLCEQFNFEYGATVGTKIEIKKPSLDENYFQYILIPNELSEAISGYEENTIISAYVRMLFHREPTEKFKAKLYKKEETYMKALRLGIPAGLGSLYETKVTEPEATIILSLSRLL